MNPIGKKFISLFIILFLFTVNCTTLDFIDLIPTPKIKKKVRHGAKLMVYKIDGQQIKGELIAVKQNSLLLLDEKSGTDVSIDVSDVEAITIIKKKGAFSDPFLGAVTGAGCGAGIWLVGGLFMFPIIDLVEGSEDSWLDYLPDFAAYGVLAGAAVGGIASMIFPRKKAFQIEEMTDSEIQETLDYLRKKARIRDYK